MYIKDAEWSKTYFFIKEKKNVGSKGKISGKMSKFLTDTLAKMAQHIFAYFFVSEHSASFSLLQQKTPILVKARAPSPPVYGLGYRFFFTPSLSLSNKDLQNTCTKI